MAVLSVRDNRIIMKVEGVWRGEYADQYDEIVEFRIDLNQGEEGFEGICYDLYEKSIESKVVGFIENDLISFVKEYEEAIVIDKIGDVFVDKDSYHPGVHYYGRYNSETARFEGTWEIQVNESEFGKDESLIWFDYGSWWMEKTNDGNCP